MQFDFGTIDPNTKSGDQLAADLNAWRDALHTTHKGAARPVYAQAGMIWCDNAMKLWLYNGSADVDILGSVTIVSTQITDSTAAGRAMLQAANAAAQLVLLGLAQSTESALGLMRIVDATTINAGTDDLEAVTTKKLNDSKYNSVGKQSMLIPASSLLPHPSAGPTGVTVATATNLRIYKCMRFADGVSQTCGMAFPMPKKIDHTVAVSYRLKWTAAASGNVRWMTQISAASDGDAIDVTPTSSQVTSTIVANTMEFVAETVMPAIPGIADEDMLFLTVTRVGADAADTLAANADLLSVELFFTTQKGTDA